MVGTLDPEAAPAPAPPAAPRPRGGRSPLSRRDPDRRRFTIAVLIGAGVTVLPMLWLLWDMWSGTVSPLRGVPYDNFYDLQARAMFHGHLWIPPGYMGIEAFRHAGHQYTYFGLFPSLLRMPVLAVTNRFDGQLTAPSLLLAWVGTAVFTSLLVWRLRILARGRAALGRAEAVSYGLLMASITGGSVVIYLVATPFIYNEDFAWSIALTVGSLFALLGVMERPGRGRVWAAGILVLLTNLDRTPTGYACVIGALLVAGWFALGKGGADRKRWALPVALAGIVPFVVGCLVTEAKFGIPIGLPMADQVWASVNAHRRYFLQANGGKAFSPAFLPTTLVAYLQPFGIHLSPVFPYFGTPTAPAAAYAGAVMDQLYPTASAPPTMPLVVGLSAWGVVASFRRGALGRLNLTRVLLVAALAGTAGVLMWGYVSERYLGDLMPFFVLASAIGMVDLWRRLEGRTRRVRTSWVAAIGVLAVWGVAANIAIAASPVTQWTPTQASRFVGAQHSLSLVPLASTVHQGATLPLWAPEGQLFIAGNCSGLYLSSGNSLKDVPGQQIQHLTWIPVERGPGLIHSIGFTVHRSRTLKEPVTLLSWGASRLVLRPWGHDEAQFAVLDSGTSIPWPTNVSWHFPLQYLDTQYKLTVITDPNMHLIELDWYGSKMIGHYLGGSGPAVVHATSVPAGAPLPQVTVARLRPQISTTLGLCRVLQRQR